MAAELVIFDCDGVLVDSERLCVRVEADLLAELGWPLSISEVVGRFVGRSDSYMHAEIEAALGRPVPEWQDRYEAALRAAFHAELRPVDGVVAALDAIDVPTCVASSGTHEKFGALDLRRRGGVGITHVHVDMSLMSAIVVGRQLLSCRRSRCHMKRSGGPGRRRGRCRTPA